jgi:RNA polymerase sigma-70 factor (ECF subfamily)
MPTSAASGGSGLSGSSLVRGLRARSPEAWQRFLRLYGPLIYSWCRTRWQLKPDAAADILQEVALRVHEAIADYRSGDFVAWLWQITRSRVVRHLERNSTPATGGSDAQRRLAEVADPQEEAQDDPGAAADRAGVGGVLQRALDRVRARSSGSSWQAFWQVVVEGRKPADVAGDLGLTANAVYIAVSRTLSRLRAELGELETGDPE